MPALGAWTPCCCPFLCPTQSSRNDRFERGDLESRSPLPSATQRPGVIKRAGYQRLAAHNAIAQYTDEERGMQQAAALAGGGGLRGCTSAAPVCREVWPCKIGAEMQAIQ